MTYVKKILGWCLCLGLTASALAAPATLSGVKYPGGKIAVVADGNSPDPDDIGGTAFTIALLKAAGMNNKLVHYSHSCDLVRDSRITASEEAARHVDMEFSCTETARRWGGYTGFNWQDAKLEEADTVEDLKNAINASRHDDKLYIIEAGEPDIIYKALDAAQLFKSRNVKIITHHVANDDSGDFYNLSDITRDFPDVEVLRIPDQNERLQTPLADWDWAKNHTKWKIRGLWERLEVAEQDGVVTFQTGKGDASDAGMMIYWITGADTYDGRKTPTVNTMKALIER